MAHARPYDHETRLCFLSRATDAVASHQPDLAFEQSTDEINEKINRGLSLGPKPHSLCPESGTP